MTLDKSPNVTHKVTKSNDLIESTYKLTLQEHRIISTLISMVEPNDRYFQIYKFSVKEFAEMIGIKGDMYTYIKRTVTDLQEKTVEIPTEKSTLVVNWLASAEYFDQEGFVELEISSKLKPYLLELKERFTSYHLQHVLSLSSSYSMRIYELLKQYQYIKHKKRTIKLQQLREWLGFVGENGNKYRQYGHFKAKVLRYAYKDINENTDIKFEFEEVKNGRKVEGITFIIHNNDPQEMLFSELNQLANGYNITKETFKRWVNVGKDIWGEMYIEQLKKLVLYVNDQGNKKSAIGLAFHVLKEKEALMKQGENPEIIHQKDNEKVITELLTEHKGNNRLKKGNTEEIGTLLKKYMKGKK